MSLETEFTKKPSWCPFYTEKKKLSGVRVSVFGTEGDSFDLRYIAQDILVYHLVTAHIFRFNPE